MFIVCRENGRNDKDPDDRVETIWMEIVDVSGLEGWKRLVQKGRSKFFRTFSIDVRIEIDTNM